MTTRLYKTAELEPLIETLPQRTALLERWRRDEHLSTIESQAVWLILHQIVRARANQHYKARQKSGRYIKNGSRQWYDVYCRSQKLRVEQDKHHDRMLELAKFMRRRLDKSVAWCVSAYKMRFAQYEAKLELRRWGFGEPTSEQSQVVNDLVKLQTIHRKFPRQSPEEYAIMLCIAYPRRFKSRELALSIVAQFIRYLRMITAESIEELNQRT